MAVPGDRHRAAAVSREAVKSLPVGENTMERLMILLAMNGALVLIASFVAGLLLHRTIRLEGDVSAWHLAHAGGSGRAVLLIALAPILRLTMLSPGQLSALVWLMLLFAWTSMLAMTLGAASGARGLGWHGSHTNKLVFGLYVVGAIAVFPAAILLVVGLLRAL